MERSTPDTAQVRTGSTRALFWSALATSVTALVTFAVTATTPPRTGPFAAPGTALTYPFAAAAKYVPGDFVWMYFALVALFAYLVWAVVMREHASGDSRIWGTLGLGLALVAFAVLATDYFVQIHTIQPALAAGEAADVVALSQYNPHGLFIALEELGYLAVALSLGAFAVTLGGTRLRVAGRWVLGGAAALGLIAFVAMSVAFGVGLEYRFEVAIIAIVYLALVVGGALVALSARRARAA